MGAQGACQQFLPAKKVGVRPGQGRRTLRRRARQATAHSLATRTARFAVGGRVMSPPLIPVCFVWRITDGKYPGSHEADFLSPCHPWFRLDPLRHGHRVHRHLDGHGGVWGHGRCCQLDGPHHVSLPVVLLHTECNEGRVSKWQTRPWLGTRGGRAGAGHRPKQLQLRAGPGDPGEGQGQAGEPAGVGLPPGGDGHFHTPLLFLHWEARMKEPGAQS
jgi:hypothetical protein